MTRTVKVTDLPLNSVIVEGQGDRTKRIRVTKITRCPGTTRPRYAMPYFHINDYYCYWGNALVEIEEGN